ncbi:hypothetical protein [Pseudoduganella sp. RAF53_2]|uniref:hypothetical protein n=1 Tax=unclassified Pseudoduganella TaxID=2637179 RepID=UPI003F9C93B5
MKRVILTGAISIFIYGCASTSSLKDSSASLTGYADNRVGYILSNGREVTGTRVWSNDNQILALRIKGRLINAKDLDSVTVTETKQSRAPLKITVTLKAGEVLAADVPDWGYEVEWVACTAAKVCEYLVRAPSAVRHLSFPTFPALLSVATFPAIEVAAHKDGLPEALAKSVLTHNLDDAFGYSQSSYTIKFQPVDQASDLKGAIEKQRARQLAKAQCISEAMRRGDDERQAQEKEVRRRAPPGKENEWVEAWRSSNSPSFWRSQAEMACNR